MTVYLLDSNVFIEAANRYYAFDLVPQFWSTLILLAKNGSVKNIDKVHNEISENDDEVKAWVNDKFKPWFENTHGDVSVLEHYRQITAWAKEQYRGKQVDEFCKEDKADPWIISYAKDKGHTVVTHEKYKAKKKKNSNSRRL